MHFLIATTFSFSINANVIWALIGWFGGGTVLLLFFSRKEPEMLAYWGVFLLVWPFMGIFLLARFLFYIPQWLYYKAKQKRAGDLCVCKIQNNYYGVYTDEHKVERHWACQKKIRDVHITDPETRISSHDEKPKHKPYIQF